MGTSTQVQVETETTPAKKPNKGKKPQRSNLKVLMDKAMKRSAPPPDDSDPSDGSGDENPDDDLYLDTFTNVGTNRPDGKILGNLPSKFTGDRSKAEEFLTNMQAYFRLNITNAQIRSPMTRVALCLANMEGIDVEEWKTDIGIWYDKLKYETDDRQGVWNTFEYEFKKQFEDSQKEIDAQVGLKNLKMDWPLIDRYVSNFERLARLAGYNHTNAETMQYFMNGLPKSILTDTLRPPVPTTYHTMKSKAIEAVRSRVLIDAITKGQPGATRPMNTWNQQSNPRPRPSYNQPRFNSSTAPPSYNNRQVPMDLSRTRAPRSQGPRINAGQDGQRRPRGPCYNCGKDGHFARDCRQPKQIKVNYGWTQDTQAYQAPPGWTYTAPQTKPDDDPVDELQARVLALSPEDKGRLLQSYGAPTEETRESDF
jgi:hypothetical protein